MKNNLIKIILTLVVALGMTQSVSAIKKIYIRNCRSGLEEFHYNDCKWGIGGWCDTHTFTLKPNTKKPKKITAKNGDITAVVWHAPHKKHVPVSSKILKTGHMKITKHGWKAKTTC